MPVKRVIRLMCLFILLKGKNMAHLFLLKKRKKSYFVEYSFSKYNQQPTKKARQAIRGTGENVF